MSAESLIAALAMLVPGFVSTGVRDQLHPTANKTDFERTLESLIWTFLIYLPFAFFLGRPIPVLSPNRDIVPSVLLLVYGASIFVGALRALAAQRGWGLSVALWFGLTRRRPQPSLWIYAVQKNSPGWALVRLKNGQKFHGFIEAYDDQLERSEFYMERVTELDDDFKQKRELKDGGLLVTRDQTLLVEFYPENSGR